MTATPPSPQSPLDELPRVQHFLELAAPLFLDRRELDDGAWIELRGLARQSGLSEEELHGVVKSLQRRGVIHEHASSINRSAVDFAPNPAEARAEIVPPPPPAPAPPPPPRSSPAISRWAESDERKLFSTFLERAQTILAERRGLDAAAYAMLADIAHSLGLTEHQFDEAIHVLGGSQLAARPPAPPPTASQTSITSKRDSRPDETFRRYLKLAIQDKHRSKGYLSESVERKLVEEGVRKLGLSPVFARHLVHEIAEQCGTTVISQQDADNAERDPQFDQFLSRALPILAQQRGMTTRARVMLSALAQELGMSNDAIERAVALLQHSAQRGDTAHQWRSERREAFRNDLRRILANTPGGMLPPAVVEDLIWRGQYLYGMEIDAARSSLAEISDSCGVTSLTPDQTVKCIAAVVQDKLGGRTRLTADDEWQVFTYGEQLGLEEDQLRKIVRDCVQQGRRRRIRERNITSAILVLSGLAVVVLLGLFYSSLLGYDWKTWFALENEVSQEGVSDESTSTSGSNDARGTGASADPHLAPTDDIAASDAKNAEVIDSTSQDLENITDPARRNRPGDASRDSASSSLTPSATAQEWWDADLAVALVEARNNSPEARKDDYSQIEHGTVDQRASAYERLVAAAIDESGASRTPAFIGALLIECIAKDPDEFASSRLVNALIDHLPDATSKLPEDPVYYDRASAALHILVSAAESTATSATRVALIQETLSTTLGESLVVGSRRAAFESDCFAAWLQRQFRILAIAAAERRPAVVVTHAEALMPFATKYLQDEQREQLILEVLAAGLATAGDEWREYGPLFDRAFSAEDSVIARKLLNVFENTEDVELRKRIAELLVPHLDVEPGEPIVLDEVPDRVRSSIGASTPETLTRDHCLAAFREEAQAALRIAATGGTDQAALVQQILQLSRLASQGFALSRDDVSTYQELSGSDEDEPVAPEKAEFRAMPDRITGNYETQANKLVDVIRRTNRLEQRLKALDTLSSIVPMLDDIHPDTAELLAVYYVSDRNDTEQRERIARLSAFKKWNNLRIALAHEIGSKAAYDFQLEEIVTAMCNEPFKAANNAKWPRLARGHMLREAYGQLSASADPTDASDLAALEAGFRKNLLVQARLSGVDAKELDGATEPSPAAILRSIASAQSNALKSLITDPAQSKKLADLAHRIAAVDYLSSNDLQRTVYLDRAWVELLAMQIDAELKGSDATQMYNELLQKDLETAGLLDQLRRSQEALVRMWLMRLERAGE